MTITKTTFTFICHKIFYQRNPDAV